MRRSPFGSSEFLPIVQREPFSRSVADLRKVAQLFPRRTQQRAPDVCSRGLPREAGTFPRRTPVEPPSASSNTAASLFMSSGKNSNFSDFGTAPYRLHRPRRLFKASRSWAAHVCATYLQARGFCSSTAEICAIAFLSVIAMEPTCFCVLGFAPAFESYSRIARSILRRWCAVNETPPADPIFSRSCSVSVICEVLTGNPSGELLSILR